MTGRDSSAHGRSTLLKRNDKEDGPGVFPIPKCPVCGVDGKIVSFQPTRWKSTTWRNAAYARTSTGSSGASVRLRRGRTTDGRSALGWLQDQYQISTDKMSGIVNDPNDYAGGSYILRLVASVVTVSVKTMEIVESMPSVGFNSTN